MTGFARRNVITKRLALRTADASIYSIKPQECQNVSAMGDMRPLAADGEGPSVLHVRLH